MSSQTIILNHDKWRKGIGGAPAGLAGQADSNAYAGLDLNLAVFASSTFMGSSFTATTFHQGQWNACTFTGASFTACDFEGITMAGCTFNQCTFSQSQLTRSTLNDCTFESCELNTVTLDAGQWSGVRLLNCFGTELAGHDLRGEHVKWEGSHFRNIRLVNARINLSM
ncbi:MULTISPECIES: pentapeptide repeat-containing protein [unclassified Variovorax]|uniref:pentapeptide repeat-containing protein n=1 Tax=unclassified Variovorax TaxID=663243 RepID=UPI001BD3B88B|nr:MULTISPECIES: pentapeptide repeat-containing protein [unclassified Variovorax]